MVGATLHRMIEHSLRHEAKALVEAKASLDSTADPDQHKPVSCTNELPASMDEKSAVQQDSIQPSLD